MTVTRLSLGVDPGPWAIGPAGLGGAQTFPPTWSFTKHYRMRPGAIFAAYVRSDLRSAWWPPGSEKVLTALNVTYTKGGVVRTTTVPLGHPACISKPSTP